jgi:hypothetical protein
VTDGWDGLRGTVPADDGGVRIIVEAIFSLLAITCAITKNARRGKIMREGALLYAANLLATHLILQFSTMTIVKFPNRTLTSLKLAK